MHKYEVEVREVHVSTKVIESKTPLTRDQLVAFVEDGYGEEILCEYSDTCDSSTWRTSERREAANGVSVIEIE